MEKTLAEKLAFKPGRRMVVMDPPPDYRALLGAVPEGAERVEDSGGPFEMGLLFVRNRAALEERLPALKERLAPAGMLWVAYYKGTARVKTDINRDSINAYGLSIGLQAVMQVAIDTDWSALRMKHAS